MNYKIKNVLLKLIDRGFEAYLVGGFVRDYILGIESFDVDISTNALPKDVMDIFDLNNSNDENYGSVHFKDSLYNYDITTFRKEFNYSNRKPVDMEYAPSIEEDVKRRDFTINALYMDVDGNIHDLVDGKKDLEKGIIRSIGNINNKMTEDPLRLLRAVRFAATFDFSIESNLYSFIRQNKQLLRTISYSRKKIELSKMFKADNKLQGIKLIRELDIASELELKIPEHVAFVEDELGIWAQLEFKSDYPFKNSELDTIAAIRKVMRYGIIDNAVLYECGLYVCMIAGEILGVPRGVISELYKNMPIYTVKDIALDGDDIISILGIEPSNVIKDIIFDLELNILNGNLKNDYDSLKQYLLKNWRAV